MTDKNNDNENNKNLYLSYGTSFGLLAGTITASILGMLFETILVWAITPGFGLLAGIIIGMMMDANKNDQLLKIIHK